MQAFTAQWGSDEITVSCANWADASQPVVGSPSGWNAGRYRHSWRAALRHALRHEASAEGMDLQSDDVLDLIQEAIDSAADAADGRSV